MSQKQPSEAKLTWHTEQRKVSDLVEMEENPRKLSKEQERYLIESFEKFDLVELPAVDTDGTIVAGHQRMKIMALLGRDDEIIDVRVPNRKLTKAERKEYNLRSNKNTGEWDNEKLAQFFDEDMLKEVGFTEDEIAKAIRKAIEGEEDEFDATPPKEPKSKLGDVFILGDHVLMCGDSTKKEDVEKLMGGVNAEMVFTDPPYNVDYKGGMNAKNQNTREGIQNDKMSTEDFYKFLYKAIKNMVDFCDGCLYICMSSSELVNLKNAFESAGGHWQSFIIWAKNTFTLSRADFQNQYEPILYGWNKNVVNHYFIGWRNQGNVWKEKPSDEALLKWAKTMIEKTETDVWEEKKPAKSIEHPTMKPIKLVVRAIQASSRSKGIVLDLFGGSGSTLIACEQTGRKCRMMELDPKYCDVIIARWEEFTGKEATLVG